MIRIQHVPYWFESRLDPFVRRHEKLKGPKGLSQEVRDTAVIHNQASLRPCIRQRGITPALSTGMRQYYIQNKACNSISYWNGQNGSPDYLILVLALFQYLCTSQISQFSFFNFTLMYPSASTPTIKSGFMLWVKQSANCLPVSIHSISSPAGLVKEWIEPVVLPGSHMRLPMCIRYLGSVQAKHTHTYTNYLFTRHGAVHLHTHTRNKRKLYRDDLCHSPFWDGFARHSFFCCFGLRA